MACRRRHTFFLFRYGLGVFVMPADAIGIFQFTDKGTMSAYSVVNSILHAYTGDIEGRHTIRLG